MHLSGAEHRTPCAVDARRHLQTGSEGEGDPRLRGMLSRRLQPRGPHSLPELRVLPQPETRHWVPVDAQELGRETVDTRLLRAAVEDSLISMMSLSRVWLL